MNTIDELTLLRYIDGDLDDAERALVEEALSQDQNLRDQLDAMLISDLPFADAFNDHMTLPVPDSLRRSVEQMSENALQEESQVSDDTAEKPRRRVPYFAMAATFVLGVGIGLLADINKTVPGAAMPAWVNSVVEYHRLYTRETVAQAEGGLAAAQPVLDRLKQSHGMQINVPDLKPLGFDFKRAQLLGLETRPLLQMVYMGDTGHPMAFCLAPAEAGAFEDTPVEIVEMTHMWVATWRENGIDYVLVGRMQEADPQQLVEKIRL